MAGKRKVEEYISYLRYEKRYSQHTLVAYQGDLNQFRAYLGDRYHVEDWKDVKMLHLRSWIYDLTGQDLEKTTINRKITTLRSFYQFLKKEGFVTSNPVLSVRSMRTSKHLPEVIPEASIKTYFQMSDQDTWKDKRDRLLIGLLYETGMRRAELMELKWQEVNVNAGYILVTGKRQKQRQIPLRTQLAQQLRDFRESTHAHLSKWTEYVMVNDRGDKVYPKWIYNKVRSVLSIWASSEKISPHTLRHSIATHLLDAGADIQIIRELLGHSSLAATEIYTHNSIEKLKQSYKKALPDLDADFH